MNFQRDDTTVAQSVAHLPCMQKVGASNPLEDVYIYLIAGGPRFFNRVDHFSIKDDQNYLILVAGYTVTGWKKCSFFELS